MYKRLQEHAENYGIKVLELKFDSNAKGLCNGNVIGINSSIETEAEKACVLAEEIGHVLTTYGDIMDQNDISNIKQELKARAWGYSELVKLESLFLAYKSGVHNRFELAEYLEVTEEYLEEAIDYYKSKYGPYYQADGYMICFEPFGVLEIK